MNKQVSIRLTEGEHGLVEYMAAADERTPTEIARRAFRYGLPTLIERMKERGIEVPQEYQDDGTAD